MKYEELLEEAYKKIKKKENSGERFEIPKVQGRFEGKKTIITNFAQISSLLRREDGHLFKFLMKGLATQGEIKEDKLIINNKIPSQKINQKIEEYTLEFVLCKECKKPDTEITREERVSFLHCLACGAKHPIRSKI